MSSPYVVNSPSDAPLNRSFSAQEELPSHTQRRLLATPKAKPDRPQRRQSTRVNHSKKLTTTSLPSSLSHAQQEPAHDSSLHSQIHNALTYLPTIVARNIEARTVAGKNPIRCLGEYGHEEFNGACAFFDISGFSKLASRLGKREREESKKRRRQTNNTAGFDTTKAEHSQVRGNSLLGKKSNVSAKNLMLSRAETIAQQHEANLKLLPEILSARRGMGAETLAYAIKELFGKLVDRIQAAGGDIIKFAGDALICVWSGDQKTPVGVLVYHAIQCGFQLSSHIENISLGRLAGSGPASSLHLHVAVGSGPMRLVHVGGESGRWEYWVAGDGVSRACDGVDLSKPGEIVLCKTSYSYLEKSLKRAAKLTGETLIQGKKLEGGQYHMLTALDAPVPPMKSFTQPKVHVLKPILAYCPCNVKRAVENISAGEDSIREVAIVFVLFNGMDQMKEAEHVGQVDGIFRSVQRSIYTYGGILRQFVVDDKGAVAVIVVGFPYFNYVRSEQASRAVGIGLDIRHCMRPKGVTVRVGITLGTVFCGNVGNQQRRYM